MEEEVLIAVVEINPRNLLRFRNIDELMLDGAHGELKWHSKLIDRALINCDRHSAGPGFETMCGVEPM